MLCDVQRAIVVIVYFAFVFFSVHFSSHRWHLCSFSQVFLFFSVWNHSLITERAASPNSDLRGALEMSTFLIQEGWLEHFSQVSQGEQAAYKYCISEVFPALNDYQLPLDAYSQRLPKHTFITVLFEKYNSLFTHCPSY